MKITYYKKDKDSDNEVVSVSVAKKLIKQQGGSAWTETYERDGGLCDVREIKLTGNNSNIKMNHHL